MGAGPAVSRLRAAVTAGGVAAGRYRRAGAESWQMVQLPPRGLLLLIDSPGKGLWGLPASSCPPPGLGALRALEEVWGGVLVSLVPAGP